jgi:hypothetical protein
MSLHNTELDETIEGHLVAAPAPGVVQSIVTAEMGSQIDAARRHPRDARKSLNKAVALATLTQEGAEQCMYALQRKDKDGKVSQIEGASVRLAEILIASWGNCRAGARVVDEGPEFVTAQGVFFDLEANTALTFEVRRRITTNKGKRFGADMIAVTANAACSIALRNAVLKGVPKALWEPVYLAARKTAIGDQRTLATRTREAIAFFVRAGAVEADILTALGVSAGGELTADHFVILRGLANALKSGEVSIDAMFKQDGPAQREVIRLTGGSKPAPDAPSRVVEGEPDTVEDPQDATKGPPADDPESEPESGAPAAPGDDRRPQAETLKAIEEMITGGKVKSAKKVWTDNRDDLVEWAVDNPDAAQRVGELVKRWP